MWWKKKLGTKVKSHENIRTKMWFSPFLFFLDTLFLLCDSKPCILFDIYIYIYILRLLLHSFTYLFMCCFFYLFIHMLLLSLFTLRCRDESCLKCFRNIGCQSFFCHELSSYKVFQEFVLGLDFIVFNK